MKTLYETLIETLIETNARLAITISGEEKHTWGKCGEFTEIKITNLLIINKLVIA